jgi:lambda family phage portal protein
MAVMASLAIPRRLNWLDRQIAIFAPRAAYRRGMARAALDGTRAYDGAAVGRHLDGRIAGRTSADAEISRALVKLRNRSRDLTRNNPHARKAVAVWTSNIVGTGIVPRARSGNPRIDELANALWAEWSAAADADGQLDMGGLQELMVREMVEGGEVLVRRRLRRPEDNLPVPLQLQLMEGDLLDESRTQNLAGRNIVNGVEFDPIGRRAAYWLFPGHPGNASLLPTANIVSAPIAAGEIVHLYRKERTQVRGVPWGSAVILALGNLSDYEFAEITRKKTESCVVAIVLGADADDPIAPSTIGGMTVRDSNGNPVEQFEPGLIAYSNTGRTVEFNNPGQGGGYSEAMNTGLHSVAAGYLIPHELLTGDLSQVNFSSMRGGLNEFRRLAEAIQWLCVIPMALTPIWTWFLEAAYLAGKLPTRDIPCDWDTPAFESVNPIDDANADLIAVRAGFDSWISVVGRRTGRDPAVVMAEIAEGNALADEYGVILDSDPRNTARAGTEQPSTAPSSADGKGNTGGPPAPQPAPVRSSGEIITEALRAQPRPVVNVILPKKGIEVTRVTKHDDKGRIQEFEREERETG